MKRSTESSRRQDAWREALWRQLGAAIDMLENAIVACPEELWLHPERRPWHLAYHTLFFLDLYLSGTLEGFAPPSPFSLSELDPAGVLPERPYTRAEMLAYLDHGRRKCRATLAALDDDTARRPAAFPWLPGFTLGELHLCSLRHVQHAAAQLNLLLRQTVDDAPAWVKRASEPLEH